MATTMDKLKAVLAQPYNQPVYYLASTEETVLLAVAAVVRNALLGHNADADITRIDGPVPSMGDVIGAAGAISFFGTARIVELRLISPSTMVDKDVEELAGLFGQLENAVLLITSLYKDKKTATSKKAKRLLEAAQSAGFGGELEKPSRRDTLVFIAETAGGYGAHFAPGAADTLLERVGDDHNLLASEIAKLAAVSGYGTIDKPTVIRMTVSGIEADVFELARLITSGKKAAAFAKLTDLFALKNEPIAISAALAGTYVDMYRVRCGAENRLQLGQIFREMGYKGSEYRLQKSKENAARYNTAQLEKCVVCLADLDIALKSSAIGDKTLLLEAAVGQLIQIGGR